MKKLLFPLLLAFTAHLYAETNTLNDSLSDSQSLPWMLVQQSEDKHYDVTLVCMSVPSVGDFQNCLLRINTPNNNKKTEKGIEKTQLKNAKIMLEGGMPAHHHGLPTSPIVNWSEADGTYQIKGLKFSMPGDWFLRFHIKDSDSSLVDKVEFKFSLH